MNNISYIILFNLNYIFISEFKIEFPLLNNVLTIVYLNVFLYKLIDEKLNYYKMLNYDLNLNFNYKLNK